MKMCKKEGRLRIKGQVNKKFKPLVSIVTVVKNGEKYLEQTIQSVINQTYNNIEYIIIDGGSCDGTLDIIRKYENYIDYWVSEPDKGIYDAMNKGIKLCKGEIIGIINSTDYYDLTAVEKAVQIFREDTEISVIYGDMIVMVDTPFLKRISKPNIDMIERRNEINHPSCFVRATAYDKHGLFNENYKISADYEIMLRFYKRGLKFRYIPHVLTYYRAYGTSHTVNQFIDNFHIWKQNVGVLKALLYFILDVSFFYFIEAKMKVAYKILGKKLAGKIRTFLWRVKYNVK